MIEHDSIDDYYRNKELVSLEGLRKGGHKKWGWIVYRTTYGDDEKWAHFEERFQELVRKQTLDMDAGEHIHAQYLDFPVRSDMKYNNATTAQLRADFQEWRAGDGPLQEHEMTPEDRWKIEDANRYDYFVRVDTEAMESILGGDPWVDLVQVDWPGDDDEAEQIAYDDGHPPLEGMTTYNVGFQRVPIVTLYPFCWGDMLAGNEIGLARPPILSYGAYYLE